MSIYLERFCFYSALIVHICVCLVVLITTTRASCAYPGTLFLRHTKITPSYVINTKLNCTSNTLSKIALCIEIYGSISLIPPNYLTLINNF